MSIFSYKNKIENNSTIYLVKEGLKGNVVPFFSDRGRRHDLQILRCHVR